MKNTDSDRWHQPRCKICVHPRRADIDIELARQRPYVQIGDEFGVPYRSLANHLRKHLDFDQPIIRRVVEEESATAYEIRELGVEVAIKRRVILDACIRAALCRLVATDYRAGNL